MYKMESSLSVEDNIIERCMELYLSGFNPKAVIISYRDYRSLVESLGAKVQYVQIEYPEKSTFDGITLLTTIGRMTVLPDKFIDIGTIAVFGTEKDQPDESIYKRMKQDVTNNVDNLQEK